MPPKTRSSNIDPSNARKGLTNTKKNMPSNTSNTRRKPQKLQYESAPDKTITQPQASEPVINAVPQQQASEPVINAVPKATTTMNEVPKTTTNAATTMNEVPAEPATIAQPQPQDPAPAQQVEPQAIPPTEVTTNTSAPSVEEQQQQEQQEQQQQEQQEQQQQDPTQLVATTLPEEPQSNQLSKSTEPPPNPEDCNVFPSLFGAADDDCYTEQPMPQVQELLKQIFYEEILSVSSRVFIDILIATGNKALVDAILAKSLTPQQAEMLKQVSLDPKVAEALAQVKDRLLEGVKASVASVQENVLPQVQDAAAQAVKGTVNALVSEVSDIPPVGAVLGIAEAAGTFLGAVKNVANIKDAVSTAIAPATQAMEQISPLTDALNTAANEASESVDPIKLHPPSITMQSPPQIQRQPDAAVAAVAASAAGGGSRTRRRIHKLSRRIERTLRRVQKKYGLQDKNSFLRRTLKRK